MRRWAKDADTDDDTSSEEDSDGDASDLENDDEHEHYDAEEDSDWEDEQEGLSWKTSTYVPKELQEAGNKAIEFLANQFRSSIIRGPDYFVPIVVNPASAWQIPSIIRNSPPDLMATLRHALMHQREYGSTHDAMEEDFFRYMDREKSKGERCVVFLP